MSNGFIFTWQAYFVRKLGGFFSLVHWQRIYPFAPKIGSFDGGRLLPEVSAIFSLASYGSIISNDSSRPQALVAIDAMALMAEGTGSARDAQCS